MPAALRLKTRRGYDGGARERRTKRDDHWLLSVCARRPAVSATSRLRLSHRNYRVYISGNAIQLIGTWMQRVSAGWLTWTLTHSGAWLGLMSMAEFLPVLFVSPLAGVLADRRDRVGIIRVTQLYGCFTATLLAILVGTGFISSHVLFALVLLLGVNQGIAQPARLALIPTLVDREALPSALAINSIVFNAARFLGPAVAGLLIARVNIAAAFAANAITYIAFQVSLANLRDIPPLPMRAAQNAVRASLEAYSYASRHPGIAPMLMLFAVTTIGTRGFIELFPGFADSVFHRGPQGLAMLTSTVGLGAIFGGLWMLIRSQISGLTTIVLANTLIMSLAIIAFTATRQLHDGAALRVYRRRRDGDHRDWRADADPGLDRPQHGRAGDGALRNDLPRRPGVGRGGDGHRQRAFRTPAAAGARRVGLVLVLGAHLTPAQGDHGLARRTVAGSNRRGGTGRAGRVKHNFVTPAQAGMTI